MKNKNLVETGTSQFKLEEFGKNWDKISQDTFLEIKKDLQIGILKDINLELNFTAKNLKKINIKILVKENIKLNLIDNTNSKELEKNIEIILEKNSQLNNFQFILNSKKSIVKINLFENSIYNLISFYSGNNLENYIFNSAHHLEKNSKSNLEINGLAKDNSKIINDSKIRIEQKAKNSIGHQKMKNLILDKSSEILSEPILEVENNDVNCSHSSSISQISDKILFYINSRGISKNDATNLIAESYFTKVIENIKDEKLQEKYLKRLEEGRLGVGS